MASFYDLKHLICRLFNKRLENIDDNDIEIQFEVERNNTVSTILYNAELKELYDKVCNSTSSGIELLVDENYELAIDIDYPYSRYLNLPYKSEDSDNSILYTINRCSVEYMIFILMMYIDHNGYSAEGRGSRRPRILRPSRYLEADINNDWKSILSHLLDITSFQISMHSRSIEKFKSKKNAFIFTYIYKTGVPINEPTGVDEIIKPMSGYIRSNLGLSEDTLNQEITPFREYNADVVDYYRLACSTSDPYIKYISFYHILEYYYDEVFKKRLIIDLTEKITNPDFSYKDGEKVYALVGFIKNRIKINDQTGQGNELESLKYVLNEYVDVEELKNKLEEISDSLSTYYQNTKVNFAKAPTITWNNPDGVITLLAKRIYFTRNALVHSKSGKNSERYRPYKDDSELQKELPLIKSIAEMIIIGSSTTVMN